MKSLGPVEFVTRERYVLLRGNRIFADVVIMSGALRLAIHLSREAKNPLFMKIVSDGKQVTHVAKLHTRKERPRIRMEPTRRSTGAISSPRRAAHSARCSGDCLGMGSTGVKAG